MKKHLYASWPLKKDDNEGDKIEVEENNPLYDELWCAFEELHEMEKLLNKNNILKKIYHFQIQLKSFVLKMRS